MEMYIAIAIGLIVVYFFFFANKSQTPPSKKKESTTTKLNTQGTKVAKVVNKSQLGNYFLPALSRNATIRLVTPTNQLPETLLQGQIFTTKEDSESDTDTAWNLSQALTEYNVENPLFEIILTSEEYLNNKTEIERMLKTVARIYDNLLEKEDGTTINLFDYNSNNIDYKYCVIREK